MRPNRNSSKAPRRSGGGPARRAPQRKTLGWAPWTGLAAFLGSAAVIYVALLAGQPPLGVVIGQPALRDYLARAPFVRIDLDATRAVRDQARLAAPSVWRVEADQWDEGVRLLLEGIRTGKGASVWARLPDDLDRGALAEVLPHLQAHTGQVEAGLGRLGQWYVASPSDLENPVVQEKQTPEVILRSPSGDERQLALAELVSLDGREPRFREAFDAALEGLEPTRAALARNALAWALRPSVTLDVERTVDSAKRAHDSAPQVTEAVKEGRTLLAAGTDAGRQHVDDLQREREAYEAGYGGRVVRVQRRVGVAVVLVLVLVGGLVYGRRHRPDLLRPGPRLLALLAVTVALVAVARMTVVWGVTPLWVPVPMVVMIMCLVNDQRFGLGSGVFYSLLVRLACPGANIEFVVLLVGSVVAAMFTGRVRTRASLVLSGMLTGGAQFAAVWGMNLMASAGGTPVPLRFWESPILTGSLAALANGVLSGFVVSGILPAIERLFGVTTDIRLIEWSDPMQPLLQRLLWDAPGTYHHSMIVGSLAADAAEAVGANPLLARVGAYFHDVGKLRKPEYFAENQPADGLSPHDALAPSMSRLIITAHPRDGAYMAEECGVPQTVRDIVLQSHGSSIVRCFLDKARKRAGRPGEDDESNFRYRLPRPQTKEAAVVMLCDAVEGAARSLKAPSAARLQDLVHQVVWEKLEDGQLDECGLTMAEVKRLEDTVVRGLAAAFHTRIPYPGQEAFGQSAAGVAVAGREPPAPSVSPGNAPRDSQPPAGPQVPSS